jgi:hypothetical protein
MIKIVIWIDLNAQGVCTYQLWNFLIQWCSTSWEDSRDYKFVIFGLIELKIWINQANRRSDSNLKIVSNWSHKIRSFIVLLDSTSLKDSNEILFVQIRVVELFIWILQDPACLNQFKTNLNWIWLWARRVVVLDWSVPVRTDQQRESSDLMKSGRTRSSSTGSLSGSI